MDPHHIDDVIYVPTVLTHCAVSNPNKQHSHKYCSKSVISEEVYRVMADLKMCLSQPMYLYDISKLYFFQYAYFLL